MTSPISWLSPALIEALAWALIHFVWQGATIAALAAVVMRFCRDPGARYSVGVGALALMLAAPFVTLLFFDGLAALPIKGPVSLPSLPPALLPWAVEFWLAGVLLSSLRFAGGFLLLEKKRRGQSRPAGARILTLCHEIQQRLGLTRVIGYLECAWLSVPAVVGAFRPVVLLPVAALTGLTEAQLRAVIAHELAHVRRWDFLANLFQILTETLLFYHPAVWWLNRRIRAEREMCCDEVAISQSGNRVQYADALVEYAHALALMEEWASAPSPAMAANQGILTERIFHILGLPGEKPRIAGLAGSLILLTASLVAACVLVLPAAPAVPQKMLAVAGAAFVNRDPPAGDANPASRLNDDDYGIPSQKRLVQIRPTTHPRIAAILLPLVTVADTSDPPAPMPDTQPSAAVAPAEIPAHPVSIVTLKLDALRQDVYPAPVLKLNASHGLDEWNLADATKYCRDYAVQTVAQGANMPLAMDGGTKQRLTFFYWHCMIANANGTIYTYGDGWGASPAYIAVGAASADNPVNASGGWTVSLHGQSARTCSFIQAGNTLSGTCTGPEGSGAATGVVDGRQVRWSWKFPLDDGRRGELDFLGMIGLDGTMSGQSVALEDLIVRASEGNWGELDTFMATAGGPQVASRK